MIGRYWALIISPVKPDKELTLDCRKILIGEKQPFNFCSLKPAFVLSLLRNCNNSADAILAKE